MCKALKFCQSNWLFGPSLVGILIYSIHIISFTLSLPLSLLLLSSTLMHTHTYIMKTNEKSLVSANTNDSWGSSVTAEDIPCSEDYTTDRELTSKDRNYSELVFESDHFSNDGLNFNLFATDSDRAKVTVSTPPGLSTNETTSVEHEPLTPAHPSTEVMTAGGVSTELGASTDYDYWSSGVFAESIPYPETDDYPHTVDAMAGGSDTAEFYYNSYVQDEEDQRMIASTGLAFRMEVKQAHCCIFYIVVVFTITIA